jgi:TPR repeat protein
MRKSEVSKLLIDYSDSKLNAFKTKETDSITMEDLSPSHYKSITDWFKVHKVSAHEAANDKTTLYNLVKQSAEAGDLESEFILGLLYSEGYGVEKNSEKAIYWLRAAATQQHGYAQCTFGYMLFLGWGGWGAEKDEKQGMAWLEDSAKNGNQMAKAAIEKIRRPTKK